MSGATDTPKRMMRKPSGEIVPLPENGVIPDGCAVVAPMQVTDSPDDRLRRAIIADEKEQRVTFNDGAPEAAASAAPIAAASALFAQGSAEGMASSQVAAIVVEAEGALAALRKRASALRAAMLDPAVASDAVAAAAAEAAAIDIEADRMEVCASRLRDRAKVLAAKEADAPRWTKYNAAKVARDEAARAISEHYTELAQQIADLLTQARAADVLVGQTNADLPSGARKLEWSHPLSRDDSRFGRLCLPACDSLDRGHWPPPGHW